MSDNFYELQWNKNGGDMPGGQYASKVEALAAIKSVCQEFNDQRATDADGEFKVEDFHVHYTGPGIIVEDIGVEGIEGDLMATFKVREIDENGDEIIHHTGEWIDYEDGLLGATYPNLGGNGEFTDDEKDQIYRIVNDHFRANPIDEDLLETYQQAAETRRETARDEANSLSM